MSSLVTRRIPQLENGDRLSRDEFYRRWEAMPRLKFAERIDGEVYMQAAARREGHSLPHSNLVACLKMYEAGTLGVEAGDAGTLQIDDDNDPQPDVYLLVLPDCGGQCRFTEDDYIEGAPEFIGEVAGSSASRDLHQKLEMYERAGVREYFVWLTLERELIWHRSEQGRFVRVPPDADGIYRSAAFPGLWLAADALLAGRLTDLFAVLRQGMETPEHAAFVRELETRRKTAL